MKNYKDYMKEGADAKTQGRSQNANPYPANADPYPDGEPGTTNYVAHRFWMLGWEEGKAFQANFFTLQGLDAYKAGLAREACPYPDDDEIAPSSRTTNREARKDWLSGWDEGATG